MSNKITALNNKYRTFVIELPWPNPKLNPNYHASHWVKSPAQKEAKQIGYCEMRSIYRIGDPVAKRFRSQYTFHPPDDYRKRDSDNFVASMKHYQDGVAKALGVDDSCFEMDKPEWGDVVRGGKVTLRLAPMGETGLEELDDADKG